MHGSGSITVPLQKGTITVPKRHGYGVRYIADSGRQQDGGPDEDRTHYLVIANDALSQMSYRPVRAL